MQKRPRTQKTRNAAGLTAAQFRTVEAIGRERGLELAEGYAQDAAYCRALLDCLAIDRQRRPLKEVARFVNNLVVEVEHGATAEDLQQKYGVPATLALTLHRYALKQLGWRGAEEWFSDRERLNQTLAEDDALVG